MADISKKISRKSIKAKKNAAIKTIKQQAKQKIKEVKIEYALNSEKVQLKLAEKEQKRNLKLQKKNARLAYNEHKQKQYTLGEELFNSISHGIGVGLSIAAIVLLILKACLFAPGSMVGLYVTSYCLFGGSLFVIYIFSTLYHALTPYGARTIFSIFTHDAIFLLIAGTFSPYLLTNVGSSLGWTLFIVLWSVTAFCIVLYSVFSKKFKTLSVVVYLILGWIYLGILLTSPFVNPLSHISFSYLIAGGVAYSVGSVFYLLKNIKWAHSIFHLFVLAGSILHFFSIYFSLAS